MFRKHTTRKQLTDASFWIRKHGIRLGTLNMLGGPGGTIEDELDTLRLNIECKADHPLVSIMQPHPQFDIENITRQMGYAIFRLRRVPGQLPSHLVDPVRQQARDREPAQVVPDRGALPLGDAHRAQGDQDHGWPGRT
ncbi:MAG: hypothetical protein IPK67_19120 [Planctomycetes bacterium]|nr:hypothetical protein [Planctomycetota bacterium]